MELLGLICESQYEKQRIKHGFELAMRHHVVHAEDPGRPAAPTKFLSAKSILVLSHASSSTAQTINQIHHLYRPHHAHTHPPPSISRGTIVEVVFSDTFRIYGRRKGAASDIVLAVPTKAFGPGMFLRGKVSAYLQKPAGQTSPIVPPFRASMRRVLFVERVS